MRTPQVEVKLGHHPLPEQYLILSRHYDIPLTLPPSKSSNSATQMHNRSSWPFSVNPTHKKVSTLNPKKSKTYPSQYRNPKSLNLLPSHPPRPRSLMSDNSRILNYDEIRYSDQVLMKRYGWRIHLRCLAQEVRVVRLWMWTWIRNRSLRHQNPERLFERHMPLNPKRHQRPLY